MAPPVKPRDRSGYSSEETEQVKAACLTVAVTLGALMDDLCIVGGLVPNLLIDQQIGPDPDTGDMHPGTNDLDVGLAIGLLDEEQYAEISYRLRQEGFGPDHNERSNRHPSAGSFPASASPSISCCHPFQALPGEGASTTSEGTLALSSPPAWNSHSMSGMRYRYPATR